MFGCSPGWSGAAALTRTDTDVLTEAPTAALLLFTAPAASSQSGTPQSESANQSAGLSHVLRQMPRLLEQSNTAASYSVKREISDLKPTMC